VGVKRGSSFDFEMQSGSIGPIRMRSPRDVAWMGAEPSAKTMSNLQSPAAGTASRQRKVGGVISGGKID
jgi:hypothetical protein